nr:putative reverse transcriptase domain-containing protein [Tanacetum cinerariifolium]
MQHYDLRFLDDHSTMVRGNDVADYTQRFQELALMCTKFLADETKKVDKYINGLLDNIYGNIISARPKTLDEAIELANDFMDQKLRTYAERQNDNKRKADNSSRNSQQQQPHKKQNVCNNYKKYGHATRECRVNVNNNNNNNRVQNTSTCFECGEPGHFKKNFPELKNNGNVNRNGKARGKAYVLGEGDSNPKSNTITGTFLLNNRYASILFDTGADMSFISTAFSALINISPTTLDNHYDVELADGKIIGVNTILRGYTLDFVNHPFNIDLMSVPLGSFDVIIGMDWFREYHAIIICDEKIVRVLFKNETLIFQGKRNDQVHELRLNIISYVKAQKYLSKGCDVFLAHVTTKEAEDKLKEKRLEDVSIVKDFPEVFPEDLSGIPPTRHVEFQIDLVPGVAPVARAPYRLAPYEMKKLADQLQELSDKGFIRPSSSPWGAPVLFVKKKDGSFWMCINYHKLVRDPNKTPDSSQRPSHNCPKCGNPVDGLYCRQCALLRKKLKEVWFTICEENEIFQDFLNTSESSNDNTNVVNGPQEPFVFNQDPGENSSQSPPHIDHHCCYGCGDSLDDEVIKSSVEDLVLIPSESEGIPENMCDVPFHDNSLPLDILKDQFEDFFDSNDDSTSIDDEYFSIDDIDYVEASPPDSELVSLKEVKDDILREKLLNIHLLIAKIDSTSIDDEYFSIDDIDYVKGSPPDSELVSLEEVKDDILHEKLLNIHLLIAKIESLNDNPTPDDVLKSPSPFPIPVEDSDSFFEKSDTSLSYSNNSLPEFETFSNHTEETSSGSITTHADYSLPEYDSFIFEIEPDQGELTSVVMEDN